MSSYLRLVATWLLGAIAIWFIQFAYQVTEWVALIATALLTGFTVLLSWSGSRVNVTTSSGVIKLVLVSLVSGLMITQALDVAYQSAALPAGNRFGLIVEVLFFAAQVLPVAYLGGRLWPRAKPKVNTDTRDG